MKTLAFSFCLLVSIAVTAPLVTEAQAPTAEQTATAREAYGRGQAAYEAGNFVDAESAFNEAYAAVPNPLVLMGIAHAREGQGNGAGAVEAFERYLAASPDAADAAEVRAKITELRAAPATLVITSTPAGAAISVDGNASSEVTPAEIQTPAGAHVITLTLDGHVTQAVNVDAPFATRVPVTGTLTAATATTTATTDATDAGDAETGDADVGETDTGDETVVETGDLGDDLSLGGVGDYDLEDPEEEGPGAGVWVATGIAGAALVTGTVLGFMALNAEAEFDDMPSEETADRGERLSLFADIAFGVAAAGTLTAVVLFIAGKNRSSDDDEMERAKLQLAPVMSRRGGGVSARLQF